MRADPRSGAMPAGRDCLPVCASRLLLSLCARGRDLDRVFRSPTDDDLPPYLLESLRGGRFEVLADDLKLSTRVEHDEVAGHHPDVGDVPDLAGLGDEAVG